MDVELEQLYERVLRRLKIVALAEQPAAEDVAIPRDYYPGVYAMLEGRGIVAWGPDEPIPQRYIHPVTDLLAERCAADFGKDFTGQAVWALPELTRQIKPQYTYDETQFNEF